MTERLYAADSHRTRFEGKVAEARPTPNGRVEVRLEATLFYPTSGGQPHDTGVLRAGEDEARVVDVREEGEAVWHVLDQKLALAPGAAVQGVIDEARRRDHREQHSGQHLLSAVLLEVMKVPTVAVHLGAELSTIDVTADKLSRDVLDRVEARAGELIRRDLPVTATIHAGDAIPLEAKRLRKAPDPEALASPRGLRVISIEGVDRDACCGTHVARTGELGLVKVLAAERGKKGETRLAFVVGGRATAALQARQNVLDELAASLTTGFRDVPGRVAKLQDDLKARWKETQGLREELFALRATARAATATPLAAGGALLLERLEGGEAGDARTFATKLVAARPDLVCVVAHEGERLTLVLGRGEKAPAIDLGPVLKEVLEALGGKGGGKGNFVQGAAPPPAKAEAALALAEKALRR